METNKEEMQMNQDLEQPKKDELDNNQQQFQWDGELFKQLIQTPEGRKEIQRAMDKGVTKGIESWKSNNLQSLIDDAVNKEIEVRYPTDEKEIEIRKLQKELKDKEILGSVMGRLAQAEIPPELSNFFIGETLEQTQEKLDGFISTFNKAVKKEVDSRLKQNGGIPRSFPTPQITHGDISKMNYTERAELYLKDPSLFRK